jgi:hypothetical protein
MAVGPMIGVHRKLPFDFGEAFLGTLQEPMRFGEFFDKRDGHFVLRRIVFEPAANSGFEFGGVFVAQDEFLGAAAVDEPVHGRARFAFDGARASGARARVVAARVRRCGLLRQ